MADDPDFSAFRRFYAKGGQTEAPSRLQKIQMALYGSQNYADGGEVEEPSRLQRIQMALYGSQNYADGGYVGDAAFTDWLGDHADGGEVEGGPNIPERLKGVYEALAPAPDTEYGSILPVAVDKTSGEKRWALPSVLRDLALGGVDLLAATETGEITDRALSALLGSSMGTGAALAPRGALAAGASLPVRAHHGSPYKFDRFDSSHLNKGEGNQSFGTGLYFAENPFVAKKYQRELAALRTPGEPGYMYDVDLNIDPREMLSLDVPLLNQPKGKRVAEILGDEYDFRVKEGQNLLSPYDTAAYEPIQRLDFADAMKREGFPGISYLDGRSRAAGFGTSNHVIFPGLDDLISIKSRYADGGEVEGGPNIPERLKGVYEALAPAPDTEYGSILPFAVDKKTGEKRWALPSMLRDLAQGGVDLLAGVETGEITDKALAALVGSSMGTGAALAPRGALAAGAAKGPSKVADAAPWGGTPMLQVPKHREALLDYLAYLGGIRKSPITPNEYFENPPPTTFPWLGGQGWMEARINPKPGQPEVPYIPVPEDQRIVRAISAYTGSDYVPMNNAMRGFSRNKDKVRNSDDYDDQIYGLEWWRTGKIENPDVDPYADKRADASYLAKWLQDQEYELPFDVYRGSRIRYGDDEVTNLFPEHGTPQVHGRGIGSFSFSPGTARNFIDGAIDDHKDMGSRVPFVARIPAGTKIRGYNVADNYMSSNSGEREVLMAPFHGFDVTDVGLLSDRGSPEWNPSKIIQMDIEPSGIYDPFSPQIYADGGKIKRNGQ